MATCSTARNLGDQRERRQPVLCLRRTGTVAEKARGISAFMVEAIHPGYGWARGGQDGTARQHDGRNDLRERAHSRRPADRDAGPGFRLRHESFDLSRPTIGVLALGIARSALDVSARFASTRVQFGQPVNQFQGVQFMLADMRWE